MPLFRILSKNTAKNSIISNRNVAIYHVDRDINNPFSLQLCKHFLLNMIETGISLIFRILKCMYT